MTGMHRMLRCKLDTIAVQLDCGHNAVHTVFVSSPAKAPNV